MYLHIVHMNLFQLTRILHNAGFSRNQNVCYVRNRCMYHQIWDLIGNPSSAVFPPERLDIFGQTREHPCCLYSILCQSLLLATREQSKLNWIESHSLPSFKYETKSIPSLAVHDIPSSSHCLDLDLNDFRSGITSDGHFDS